MKYLHHCGHVVKDIKKLYCETYIGKYEDDIKEMFEHGEAISSKKMNA